VASLAMTFAEPLPHISSIGHLVDGQRRLGAVVRASVTVPMIVVGNIPPEVMPTVDAGAERRYADALTR
jgi:hypothetical protein